MNEAYHRALVSGQLRGWQPSLLRLGLSGLSLGYGLGTGLRSLAFRCGLLKSVRVSVPVISLGNITTGGTGKTPFAAFVARWFRLHGVRVCFFSRRYRDGGGGANGEALGLEGRCPDRRPLRHPDRVAARGKPQHRVRARLAL